MNFPSRLLLTVPLFLLIGCAAGGAVDPNDPSLQLNDPPPPLSGVLTDADAFAFIQGEAFGQESGQSVAVADFDGDGLADLAIGAPGNTQGDVLTDPGVRSGRVYLFRGPITEETGDLSQADTVLYGSEHFSAFGAAVAGGDLDGDGFSDLVVGDGLSTFVFYGPIDDGLLPDTEADAHIAELGATIGRYQLGRGLDPLGDFDGDGDMDIALLNWSDGFLFFDAPEGELRAEHATGRISSDSTDNLRYPISTGDLNGDGRDDLVAQTKNDGAYNYSLHVFFGPLDGDRSFDSSDAVIEGGELGQVAHLDAEASGTELVVLFRSPPLPIAWSLRSFSSPSGVLAEEDGTPLVVEGPADTNPWLNLSSGDLNSDGNIDLVAGGRVFYGPFPEARAAAAADVVVEGASQGFSIVSDDLNFDGVDDLVCGLPGFMDFPADNEERGFRPHGAVQLFSGGRG